MLRFCVTKLWWKETQGGGGGGGGGGGVWVTEGLLSLGGTVIYLPCHLWNSDSTSDLKILSIPLRDKAAYI